MFCEEELGRIESDAVTTEMKIDFDSEIVLVSFLNFFAVSIDFGSVCEAQLCLYVRFSSLKTARIGEQVVKMLQSFFRHLWNFRMPDAYFKQSIDFIVSVKNAYFKQSVNFTVSVKNKVTRKKGMLKICGLSY